MVTVAPELLVDNRLNPLGHDSVGVRGLVQILQGEQSSFPQAVDPHRDRGAIIAGFSDIDGWRRPLDPDCRPSCSC